MRYIKYTKKSHIFLNKYNDLCGINAQTSLAGRLHPHGTDTLENLSMYRPTALGHDSDAK